MLVNSQTEDNIPLQIPFFIMYFYVSVLFTLAQSFSYWV